MNAHMNEFYVSAKMRNCANCFFSPFLSFLSLAVNETSESHGSVILPLDDANANENWDPYKIPYLIKCNATYIKTFINHYT
ncbi:hypothetical protein V1527DRAFT_467280 [Lipomyces starkeyi]